MKIHRLTALPALLLAAACADDEPNTQKQAAPVAVRTVEAAEAPVAAVAYDIGERAMTKEELDRARRDGGWREVVSLDTTGAGMPVDNPETWEGISADAVNRGQMFLPLAGDPAGPSVLRTQILLDRALFSPGIMDGRWGKNTETALYWFQSREGLPTTARLDSATFRRLREVAGNPGELVERRTLTAKDVSGPFTEIPEDIYAHAELECSCYETLSEKLSEMFHVTPDLLGKLNPGVDLNTLRAGQPLNVPSVRRADADGRGNVARIVVSGKGTYVHGVDADGKVLYHFPSTLGGKYSPSPRGDFKVRHVANDPEWHYQPDILVGVDNSDPPAMIPAGPNVAVGTVWIALTQPHYGIHGTARPETIGYASSNGCVRLTNWDATFLARFVKPGTPVEFRDISGDASRQTTTTGSPAANRAARRDTASATSPVPRTRARGDSAARGDTTRS